MKASHKGRKGRKELKDLTRDEIREVWVSVLLSDDRGSFLKAFARAAVRADPENFEILAPVALLLIAKYELTEGGI